MKKAEFWAVRNGCVSLWPVCIITLQLSVFCHLSIKSKQTYEITEYSNLNSTSIAHQQWAILRIFVDPPQMAGNDWVNSYLEAILDVGQPLDDARPSLLLRERGRFTPSRYFVEEVITGFDETDLHRSWVKVRLFVCFSPCATIVDVWWVCLWFAFRPSLRGVPRRGTQDWRICAGGSGISLVKRSRSFSFSTSPF